MTGFIIVILLIIILIFIAFPAAKTWMKADSMTPGYYAPENMMSSDYQAVKRLNPYVIGGMNMPNFQPMPSSYSEGFVAKSGGTYKEIGDIQLAQMTWAGM